MIKRGKTTKRFCPVCGKEFHPRTADIKRGWGKFCSKRCKAIHQSKIYNGISYISKQPHEDVVYEYDYGYDY